MPDLYPFIKPLLMKMDAEAAHRLVLGSLKAGLGPRCVFSTPALEVKALGKTFPNPLGLAAGFDKGAEALPGIFNMGFGFAEAGTVTPRPQTGNPRPRIFRDVANESVINRMGFPGRGLDAFEKNFRAFKAKYPHRIVGANIGINKDEPDPPAAYLQGLRRLADVADYIAVNVSSPNTAGLRDLQAREGLERLLGVLASPSPAESREREGAHAGGMGRVRDCPAMSAAGEALTPTLSRKGAGEGARKSPLLLKVAPDLTAPQRADIAELALKYKIDGLIVSNTTVARPATLAPALREEKGGLSGRLLTGMATDGIREFSALTSGRLLIVGAGGVSSAEDAYAQIRAGAALVQVYTALVYQGPALVARILEGLEALLRRDGFARVSEAIGSASPRA